VRRRRSWRGGGLQGGPKKKKSWEQAVESEEAGQGTSRPRVQRDDFMAGVREPKLRHGLYADGSGSAK